MTEQTFYEAQKLKDGTILRISANQKSAWSLMVGMIWPIVLIGILALGSSAFLARHMATKIVEPLNKLDLEYPLKNEVYEEIAPLLQRIHRQHNLIKTQMEEFARLISASFLAKSKTFSASSFSCFALAVSISSPNSATFDKIIASLFLN